MSADDPTSAEYANQQEINRLNAMAEEGRKASEAEVAAKEAEAQRLAQEHREEHQQIRAEQAVAVNENNEAAAQAIHALHAGEPLQDEPLPEPPVSTLPDEPPPVEEPPAVPSDVPHPEPYK